MVDGKKKRVLSLRNVGQRGYYSRQRSLAGGHSRLSCGGICTSSWYCAAHVSASLQNVSRLNW